MEDANRDDAHRFVKWFFHLQTWENGGSWASTNWRPVENWWQLSSCSKVETELFILPGYDPFSPRLDSFSWATTRVLHWRMAMQSRGPDWKNHQSEWYNAHYFGGGGFTWVCVEIDRQKPLCSHYRMRGRDYEIQYEGLSNPCFCCGRYGHKEAHCLTTKSNEQGPCGTVTPWKFRLIFFSF